MIPSWPSVRRNGKNLHAAVKWCQTVLPCVIGVGSRNKHTTTGDPLPDVVFTNALSISSSVPTPALRTMRRFSFSCRDTVLVASTGVESEPYEYRMARPSASLTTFLALCHKNALPASQSLATSSAPRWSSTLWGWQKSRYLSAILGPSMVMAMGTKRALEAPWLEPHGQQNHNYESKISNVLHVETLELSY